MPALTPRGGGGTEPDGGGDSGPLLECVINVSEGRHRGVVADLAAAAGDVLLDVHHDEDHHRSVLTLAGAGAGVEAAVRRVATTAVTTIDLRAHRGAHPRFGSLDVVPYVALDVPVADGRLRPGPLPRALAARDRFARWAADRLGVPCFTYGPERSLPEVRRQAWKELAPDTGPSDPHPTAGACAVGAREPLVAYNLWLSEPDVVLARAIAARLRDPASTLWQASGGRAAGGAGPVSERGASGQEAPPGAGAATARPEATGSGVRALALSLASGLQVSCNLIDPWRVGPEAVFDAVASQASIARAELVGLIPGAVLDRVPAARRHSLGLAEDATIEARLPHSSPRQAGRGPRPDRNDGPR
jgi:glutamate formiminotransferase / 5-formyltetrahydrofolate cyclo-ligase